MSEPEIARRCPHCGVSLRQSAIYCPQCGERLADHVAEPTPAEVSQAAPTQALQQAQPTPQTAATQVFNPTAHASEKPGVRERVEKIKHVSSVMIDQAAYDPSLRFLLVAAVLFVLFLILVILSKVIG
jgi:uncharacterized Zn finger protein (UPF0148 family)